MSRDLLVITAPKETTSESPAPSHRSAERSIERPSASALVEDLLAGVKREWATARPHAESLWQLAGE
jgi:hypothetical protein